MVLKQIYDCFMGDRSVPTFSMRTGIVCSSRLATLYIEKARVLSLARVFQIPLFLEPLYFLLVRIM